MAKVARALAITFVLVLSTLQAGNAGTSAWTQSGLSGSTITALEVSPNYLTDKTLFAGKNGGIYKSTDAGTSWTAVNTGISDLNITSITISPGYSADQTVFIGTNSGGVFKTTNRGSSWTAVNSGLPALGINGVAASPNYPSNHVVFAALSTGGVYRSTNSGSSWSADTIYGNIVWSFSPSPKSADTYVWASGDYGVLFTYVSSGTTWGRHDSTVVTNIAASYPDASSNYTIFGKGSNGYICKSVNGVPPSGCGLNYTLNCVALSRNYQTDTTVLAGTNANGIYISSNGGGNWSSFGTGLPATVKKVAMSTDLTVDQTYFAGTNNGVYVYAPGTDTLPPASSVTAPASGSYIKGASYNITGTANDTGSGVQKVEVGITPNGGATTWYNATGTTAWSYTWSLPADGRYTVQSRATDNASHTETPGVGVTLTVDKTPPVVSAGGGKTANLQFTQTATATDATVMTYAWTKQSGPGTVTFGSPTALSTTVSAGADGTYTLRFTATDAAGNSAYSEMQMIWDTTAPSFTITSPQDSAVLTGPGNPVTGTASDGVSGVQKVEVSTDGGATWGQATGTASWSFDWHIPHPGAYNVKARATDGAGNTGPSGAGVNVTAAAYGSPELQHYNWDGSSAGGDCTLCHLSPSVFLAPDYGSGPAVCFSCHNQTGIAHDGCASGASSHPVMVDVTSYGVCRKPTYGDITTGEYNNQPFARLKDGKRVVCATCHNVMRKAEDYGRVWELTTTGDHITYTLQNGGWSSYGKLVPRVYRDTTLWGSGGPAYSRTKKSYLVAPSEYTYNEVAGTIAFLSPQSASDYVYVTLDYPYLRASSEDNRLCSDCHAEATHKGNNCMACHQSHNTGNLAGIAGRVRTTDRTERDVMFLGYTKANSFADGDSTYDGICEVCHTATKYYRRDGGGFANHSGGVNYNGKDCTSCHSHSTGFAR